MRRPSARRGPTAAPARCLPVLLVALGTASCIGGDSTSGGANEYAGFRNPEPVVIENYAGDAMEPFISRDGAFLFFNDDVAGPPEKNLYYATFVDNTTFRFQGAIASVNTAAVDGVPTMDATDRFYYVSTSAYAPPASYVTLYAGTWTGATVSGISPLASMTISDPGILYFDIDVSPDNSTLYLSRGDFRDGTGVPSAADIVVAVDSGSGFSLDPGGAAIMAGVNSAALEYAPAISADGLELFFTRLVPGAGEARIYRAVRASRTGAFGVPQRVGAATGFVEGPAFSPDEKSLYYHRRNTSTGRFEIYRVTRP